MTVSEYNKIYLPKIKHAMSFVNCLEQTVAKTTDHEDVMRQLASIDWSQETKETLIQALRCYQEQCLKEIELYVPEKLEIR